MQIKFDPRDRNACAAVLACIFKLHDTDEFAGIGDAAAGAVDFDDDQADAGEAFDTPDPAAAFPPVPFASPAQAADIAAAPAGSTATATLDPAPASPPIAPNAAPPAVPTAGAPSAASAPTVETDKNGLPWDGRIHAGKQGAGIKVADGSWRKRRGVDDATVATVEAELRQIMAAPGPNVSPAPAAPVVTTPVAAPPPATASEPSPAASPPPPAAVSPEPAPAPAPTAAPVAPPPTPAAVDTANGPGAATTAASPPVPPAAAATPIEPPAPVDAGPLTLPVLMRKITALQTAGQLTVADTNAVAVSLGLTSVRDLVQRPDLIASFDALLPAQAA